MEIKAVLINIEEIAFGTNRFEKENEQTRMHEYNELINFSKSNDLKIAVFTSLLINEFEERCNECGLNKNQFDLIINNCDCNKFVCAIKQLNEKYPKLHLSAEECLLIVNTYASAQLGKEANYQIAMMKGAEKTIVEKDKTLIDYKFYNLLEVKNWLYFLSIDCKTKDYQTNDYNEFLKMYHKNMKLVEKYNKTPFKKEKKREKILNQLFAEIGTNPMVVSPFYCDEGGDVHIGDTFFSNFGFTILSAGEVRIGNNCRFGAYSGIYNIGHDIDPIKRKNNTITAQKTYVGNNVWFGAGVKIIGGVRIGDNAVIGAGSIVTRDIKPNAIYVGNPAKFVKFLF